MHRYHSENDFVCFLQAIKRNYDLIWHVSREYQLQAYQKSEIIPRRLKRDSDRGFALAISLYHNHRIHRCVSSAPRSGKADKLDGSEYEHQSI